MVFFLIKYIEKLPGVTQSGEISQANTSSIVAVSRAKARLTTLNPPDDPNNIRTVCI